MHLETRTVEHLYVNFEDGEAFRAGLVEDFIEGVEDTEPMFPMRWSPEYESIAEYFIDRGIVDKTLAGSWFVADDTALRNMRNTLEEQLVAHAEDDG